MPPHKKTRVSVPPHKKTMAMMENLSTSTEVLPVLDSPKRDHVKDHVRPKGEGRKLGFHNTVFIKEIPSHRTYSPTEKRQTWYTNQDYQSFKVAMVLDRFSEELDNERQKSKNRKPVNDESPKQPQRRPFCPEPKVDADDQTMKSFPGKLPLYSPPDSPVSDRDNTLRQEFEDITISPEQVHSEKQQRGIQQKPQCAFPPLYPAQQEHAQHENENRDATTALCHRVDRQGDREMLQHRHGLKNDIVQKDSDSVLEFPNLNELANDLRQATESPLKSCTAEGESAMKKLSRFHNTRSKSTKKTSSQDKSKTMKILNTALSMFEEPTRTDRSPWPSAYK